MTTLPPLFSSIATDLPCGPDMEYSPEFLALHQAAQPKAEQEFGDTIIPAETPDWNQVERQAQALCEQTCDLRVLALLTLAWAESKGLSGFADGVELIADTLETGWQNVHPRLHLDDEYDPMPRINALAALGDAQQMGRALRDAHVLADVHGQITLRDAESLLEGNVSELDSYPGGRVRLQDALKHAATLGDGHVTAVTRALDALARISDIVDREAGSEWLPDFSVLERSLGLIAAITRKVNVVAPTSVGPEPESSPDGDKLRGDSAVDVGRVSSRAASWRDAEIASREDALMALDKVCRYFDEHEPSHPAPTLIRRVQQILPLNFHELLKNLAPQGVEQFSAWMPRSDD